MTRRMLSFNNEWMTLHVKSMGKLHRVLSLKERSSDLKNGLIQVAELNERPAIALQYPSKRLPSDCLEGNSFTGFYIGCNNEFFEVQFVTNSREEANQYLLNNMEVALIATDNDFYHYIASVKPTKVKKAK